MDQVIQWNCRSVISKKSEIIYLINKYSPFILALSETWLGQNKIFNIQGYNCLREDRLDDYGGVALLIKSNISYSALTFPNHSSNFNIVGASVNNICYISLYIPYPSRTIFDEINTILVGLTKPYLLLGDFNSKHQAWGCESSDRNGDDLLELITNNNLCYLNTGKPTRRTRPNEQLSVIDLSISTAHLASSLTWTPLTSTFGSDHFPLLISFPFKISIPQYPPPRLKYVLDKNKWGDFAKSVENEIPKLRDPNFSTDTRSNLFSKALDDSATETFALKKKRSNKLPSPPWWDSDCTKAIKERKEAERNYANHMTLENFEYLSNIISKTKTLLQKKKQSGWKTFCSSISPQTPPSIVWKQIKLFRSAFQERNNYQITYEIAEQFMDKLAPPFASTNLDLTFNQNTSSNTALESEFSMCELKGILSNVKDSSPGEDGIPYSFLANLTDYSLKYYLDLVNAAFTTGEIPNSWRSQEVIPLLKLNKSPSDCSSYRPIVLSSVLAKIAEHLIKNRLEWYVERNNILCVSQFGFRKGKSTIDNLGIFVTDIRTAFSAKNTTLAILLDIQAAYDNVLHSILWQKLQSLNIPELLVNFVLNLISDRTLHLTVDNDGMKESISRVAKKGLPQGSVLSPLLYNLYVHDLESNLQPSVSVLQFADDLLIYVPNKNVIEAVSLLNSSLSCLSTWLNSNGLQLSVNKSAAVLFTRSRKNPQFELTFDDSVIPVKKEMKYLGVILDSRLTGVPHCEFVAAKCEKRLNILRCLAGVWWGAHPISLRLVYNALIRSVLDYGTFILEPGNKVGFKKLDAIQSKGLRIIAGAMKTSPINALEVECLESPLELRRQYLSDRYIFRCIQLSNHPLPIKLKLLLESCNDPRRNCLVKSFQRYLDFSAPTKSSALLPLYSTEYEALTLNLDVCLDIGIDKSDILVNETFLHFVNSKWENYHFIFTDASKHGSSGCVGVGVYHSKWKIFQQIKMPPETSVFSGECMGLLKAIEYIILARLQNTVIFTDSMSALQSLSRYPFAASRIELIFEIRALLLTCVQRKFNVKFAWIPSHCGIRGNEKADILANGAVDCGDMVPYNNCSNDLLALPRVYLQESWSELWEETSKLKGKYYHSIQPNIPAKPWYSKIKLSKTMTSCIIRMRLGHVTSRSHLARFNIIDDPSCSCGYEEQDLNHIFFSCPLNDHASFHNALIACRFPLPTNVNNILYFTDMYPMICNFLHDNNIKL